MKLCGVCIMTNDVKKLCDFYSLVFEKMPQGSEVHKTFDDEQLAIWKPGQLDQIRNPSISIMYYVKDVMTLYKRLKSYEHLKHISQPEIKPWGVKALKLNDPDGNEINLLEVMHN